MAPPAVLWLYIILHVHSAFCQTDNLPILNQCLTNYDCDGQKTCVGLSCQNPCPGICSGNASCEIYDHVPHCACLPGYSGIPFTGCKKQDKDTSQEGQRPSGVQGKRKYLVKFEEVPWHSAFERCHSMGMKLISITSESIQTKIEEVVNAAGERPKRSFWTSASDWTSKGVYVWMETGQKMEYTNWQVREPEISDRFRCVSMRSRSLAWLTGNCSAPLNYICEYLETDEPSGGT